MTDKRIKFYWVNDLSNGTYLNIIETKFEEFSIENDKSIFDIIEDYNIYLLINNWVCLKKWTNKKIEDYKLKSDKLFSNVKLLLCKFKEDELLYAITKLSSDYKYNENIIKLINELNLYKKISSDKFPIIIKDNPHHINHILNHKKLVTHFSNEIIIFLKEYSNWWKLLLSKAKGENINIPSQLTDKDKELIINKYIDDNGENFKDLEYISRLNDWFLKLSSKTKLRAKRKYNEKTEKIFTNTQTISTWCRLSIGIEQAEAIIESYDNGIYIASYSKSILENHNYENDPLWVFIEYFKYYNKIWNIELVSKTSEASVIEKHIIWWEKKYYDQFFSFKNKEFISSGQLNLFERFIKNIKWYYIEDLINLFITNHLSKYKWLENISLNLNRNWEINESNLRDIHSYIDNLLKQYRCFVEEKKIDFDLIAIESKPVKFSDIPSVLDNKYYYKNSEEIEELLFIFFSNQAWFTYLEWYEWKYDILYTMLLKENIKKENFQKYNIEKIEYIIKKGYLIEDKNGFLKIKDYKLLSLISLLENEEVIPFHFLSDELKKTVLELWKQGKLHFESSLLNKSESSYINYYFNKSEFLNWLDIRNKNSHWHIYTNKTLLYNDYVISLKILILILIKIDIELSIKYWDINW